MEREPRVSGVSDNKKRMCSKKSGSVIVSNAVDVCIKKYEN